jgi:hypothetical protein
MRFKPTSAEKKTIRALANTVAGRSVTTMRATLRHNVNDNSIEPNINIARVTRLPEGWSDTDVTDSNGWDVFADGFYLTDDGRGVVDFYVYETSGDRELRTNIQVHVENGQLAKITEGNRVLWTPEAESQAA